MARSILMQIFVRCYEELNDALPAAKVKTTFTVTLPAKATCADALATIGVPMDQVELIVVNGRSVGRECVLADNDRLACYPVFETIDVHSELKLRPSTLRDTRFVADVHLGKLAKHLRMLGFDTLYREDLDDDQLADISINQQRILLTRDKALAERKELDRVFLIKNQQYPQQLHAVLKRFDLLDSLQPLRLCLRCNQLIVGIDKDHIKHKIDESVLQRQEEFFYCKECGRIYWRGTHYQRMHRWIESLKEQNH